MKYLIITIAAILIFKNMFLIADYATGTVTDMEGIVIEKTYKPAHNRVTYKDAGTCTDYVPEKYVLAVELPSGDIEIFEVDKNTYYTIKRDVIFEFKTNIGGITDTMHGFNVK